MYKEVLELVVNITENASKCEENKVQLNSHNLFEPYAIFSRIDREDKKYINKNDILQFLNDNNIRVDGNRNTVDLFIEYYDRDFDTYLNFAEFLNFILNNDQNLIRSRATQRQTYKIKTNQFLEGNLEELVCNLLMSEFFLYE